MAGGAETSSIAELPAIALLGHAIGRQLRLVQLDQVLHLPALAIEGLVKDAAPSL